MSAPKNEVLATGIDAFIREYEASVKRGIWGAIVFGIPFAILLSVMLFDLLEDNYLWLMYPSLVTCVISGLITIGFIASVVRDRDTIRFLKLGRRGEEQ
jgi:hypothetical protein